ncbi:MAG: CYTH domain-containing protein [Patescibacteria group bacterium]|jgi:thiamine-triphosphatase
MIEVEKKFEADEALAARAVKGLERKKTIHLEDIYYETSDFALTSKDNWLRNRNGRFELKMAVLRGDRNTRHPYDNYKEIEEENAIRDELSLPRDLPFAETISQAGYAPFGPIITDRAEYKDGAFTIDVDHLPGGRIIVEVETLVEKNKDITAAEERLASFAKKRGLSKEAHYGKIFEFLKINRPEHYQALKAAGVIDKYYPE